jgi:hypothetical protein
MTSKKAMEAKATATEDDAEPTDGEGPTERPPRPQNRRQRFDRRHWRVRRRPERFQILFVEHADGQRYGVYSDPAPLARPQEYADRSTWQVHTYARGGG